MRAGRHRRAGVRRAAAEGAGGRAEADANAGDDRALIRASRPPLRRPRRRPRPRHPRRRSLRPRRARRWGPDRRRVPEDLRSHWTNLMAAAECAGPGPGRSCPGCCSMGGSPRRSSCTCWRRRTAPSRSWTGCRPRPPCSTWLPARSGRRDIMLLTADTPATLPAAQRDLLLGRLVRRDAVHRGGRGRAVERDGQSGRGQVLRLDVVEDRVAGGAVGGLDLARWPDRLAASFMAACACASPNSFSPASLTKLMRDMGCAPGGRCDGVARSATADELTPAARRLGLSGGSANMRYPGPGGTGKARREDSRVHCAGAALAGCIPSARECPTCTPPRSAAAGAP